MIQLTKDVVMTSDGTQYIVGSPRTRADKGIVLDKPRYYSTAAQAVRGALATVMRRMVADEDITTLRQFITKQKQLQEEFAQLVELLEGEDAETEYE